MRWGMPKALIYGVYNLFRVYMQKDRGYLDDKVTQYFHNGVLTSAGQKRVNVRARNNGKSQIFDIVNTATTNYLNTWNQVLCNFGPSYP